MNKPPVNGPHNAGAEVHFWQRVLGELPVVQRVPRTFTFMSLIFGAIGVCVLWYGGLLVPGVVVTSKNSTIETLEQRIKQKDELISDIRGKLDNVPAESIVQEVTKLKDKLVRLETRKVEVLRSTITQNSDGTYTIVREVAVRSFSTPNYFYVTVKSNGLVDVKLTGDGGMTLLGQARPLPNTWIGRVTNPVGTFTVTAITASNEADITYKFE